MGKQQSRVRPEEVLCLAVMCCSTQELPPLTNPSKSSTGAQEIWLKTHGYRRTRQYERLHKSSVRLWIKEIQVSLCNISYFTTTSSKGQLVQRSRGHWSCAAFVLFLLYFSLTGVHVLSRLFFASSGGSAQHISTTVYRLCWLWARRASGPRAPLSLPWPDGPFIPTGWEALTPSQFLKDTLSGTSEGSSGVQGWAGSNFYSLRSVNHYYAAIQHHLCFAGGECQLSTAAESSTLWN